jgi:CubicO group peptidase (beta-lactamase class C family)
VVIEKAPASGPVTARIEDSGTAFAVTGISAYQGIRREFTEDEILELPPFPPSIRENARRNGYLEHVEAAGGDGTGPVPVGAGQRLVIGVRLTGTLAPGSDEATGQLIIAGTALGSVAVPLYAMVADLSVELAGGTANVRRGRDTLMPARATSLAGPGTEVRLALTDHNHWSVPLHVQPVSRGASASFDVKVRATQDAPLGTWNTSLSATAFNGLFLRSLPFDLAIQPALSDAEETLIRQTITTFMTNHGIPGGSVALTHNGRLVYARGFGTAVPATGDPVTTTHLFRVASVSKPITAITVFRLIDKGLLNLTDQVFGTSAILGTTFGTEPYGTKDQITVQHLLEHTSGWEQSQDPMFEHLDLDHRGLINHMMDHEDLATTPGTTYDYLNFGYCVMGRVIEQVSGLDYGEAVRQHVLLPCGIHDMHIAGDTLTDRRANEVVYVKQNTDPYTFRASRMDAHGGWIANPTDLVRLLAHVDGLAGRPDIITAASRTTMTTPTTALTASGTAPGYAKGWGVNAAGNLSHIGDFGGTAAEIIQTTGGFGWAAVFNSRNDAQLNLMKTDLDQLLWTILGSIPDWPAIDLF